MEGDREAMVQKARELALGGDVQMLKFFLGRTLPRERLIAIDLPRAEDSTFDPAEALANVIAAVADGKITPSEGSALANLTGNYTHALDYTKLLAEIDELKAELKGLTGQLKGKK
jgi:hypothetical protein